MQFLIHVSAVITNNEGGILLVREKKDVVFKMYNLPGGHLNPGEKVIDGLRREMREELGCEIQVRGVVAVYSILEEESHYINFVFSARVSEGVPRANTQEIHSIEWRALDYIEQVSEKEILYPHKLKEAVSRCLSGAVYPLDILIEMF